MTVPIGIVLVSPLLAHLEEQSDLGQRSRRLLLREPGDLGQRGERRAVGHDEDEGLAFLQLVAAGGLGADHCAGGMIVVALPLDLDIPTVLGNEVLRGAFVLPDEIGHGEARHGQPLVCDVPEHGRRHEPDDEHEDEDDAPLRPHRRGRVDTDAAGVVERDDPSSGSATGGVTGAGRPAHGPARIASGGGSAEIRRVGWPRYRPGGAARGVGRARGRTGRITEAGQLARRLLAGRRLEHRGAPGDERQRRGPGQLLRGLHERPAELGRGEAIDGIRPAGPLEHGGEWTEVGGDGEELVDAVGQRRDRGVAPERHLAGDRLDERQRQGVHVGLAVDRTVLGLLGRDVAGAGEVHRRDVVAVRLGDEPGDAEVGDTEPPIVAEEEVARFDVAVHEPTAMGVVEAATGVEPHDERL